MLVSLKMSLHYLQIYRHFNEIIIDPSMVIPICAQIYLMLPLKESLVQFRATEECQFLKPHLETTLQNLAV